jgi:phosphoribosylamine--glycine ligase
MRVLVVGSGGREHALCWKIAQSSRVDKVFCAPGNAGITNVAESVPISASDIPKLVAYVEKEKIDLTVVGPELPLVDGIVDEFERRGFSIFGPTKRASILEGSKVFTKKFLTKYKIPTANYAVFTDASKAKSYLKDQKFPLVVKADGLAAGKGVIICKSRGDAESAIDAMLKKKEFGNAGKTIIIEDFLKGEEVSFIALSDGEHILPLASSQDHKPVYDDDHGPNTGGMGAYSPAPIVTKAMAERIHSEIMLPTIKGMKDEGREFKGFLYAGVMIVDGKPYVLEYNVRCGDPETQPLLARMDSDIVPVLEASLEGTLDNLMLDWKPVASVCVVMASRGYPGHYEKGLEIVGIEDADAMDGVVVFHAGTKRDKGKWLTNGGRVLGVTANGETIKAAMKNAYSAVEKINWDGAHYRKDIGSKALKYEAEGQMNLY